MGNELCQGSDVIDSSLANQRKYRGNDKLSIKSSDNYILLPRSGHVKHQIGYSLHLKKNQMEDQYDEEKSEVDLNQIQDLIHKMLANEKKNAKPLKLHQKSKKQNEDSDPYFIKCLNAIYLGEWAYIKEIDSDVPSGIGRLYTESRIMEGEIKTIIKPEQFKRIREIVRKLRDGQDGDDNNFQFDFKHESPMNQFNSQQDSQFLSASPSSSDIWQITICLNGDGRIHNAEETFVGNFFNGLLDKKGSYYIKTPELNYSYEGEYQTGKKHGKGFEKIEQRKHGDINIISFEGDFCEDKKKGRGVFVFDRSIKDKKDRLEDEARFARLALKEKDLIAQLKIAIKKYQARQIIADKHLEEFKWQADTDPKFTSLFEDQDFIANYFLRIVHPERYVGEYKDNEINGRGIYEWNTGKIYNGLWENGNMNGYGEFLWPDGSYYIGNYKNDKKHGKGEMTWNEYVTYRGSWAYGFRHGYGEMIEIKIEEDHKDDETGVITYGRPYLMVFGAKWNQDIQEGSEYFSKKVYLTEQSEITYYVQTDKKKQVTEQKSNNNEQQEKIEKNDGNKMKMTKKTEMVSWNKNDINLLVEMLKKLRRVKNV